MAEEINNTNKLYELLSLNTMGFFLLTSTALFLQGEIQLVRSLGVTPDDIIYTHTTKPPSHIKYACAHGVNKMTFDSEDELIKISLCHANAK